MIPSTTDPQNSISDKRRKYEIATVFLTGAGKLVFMDLLQWKLPFIIISIVGWASYVIYRSRKVAEILPYWGFRTDNFREATRRVYHSGCFRYRVLCDWVSTRHHQPKLAYCSNFNSLSDLGHYPAISCHWISGWKLTGLKKK